MYQKDEDLKYKERTIDFWEVKDKSRYRTRRVIWRHLNLALFIPSLVIITLLIIIIYSPSLYTIMFTIIIICGLILIIILKSYSRKERPLEKELD